MTQLTRIGAAVLVSSLVLLGGCGGGSGDPGTGGTGGSGGTAGTGGTGGTAGEGTGGAGGSGGSVPSNIDVHGKVVDKLGKPFIGATILLDGDIDRLETTGTDGLFHFGGVDTPYRLTVLASGQLYELRGLTRSNPVVVAGSEVGAFTVRQGAKIAGHVGGPAYPVGGKILLAPSGRTGVTVSADPANGDFDAEMAWMGDAKQTRDLVAAWIEYGPEGLVVHGLGRKTDVTLESGIGLSGLGVSLGGPIETRPTTVSSFGGAYSDAFVTLYGSFTIEGTRFNVLDGIVGSVAGVPTDGAVFYAQGYDADGNFAIRLIPAIPGGTTRVELPEIAEMKAVSPVNHSMNVSTRPTLAWTQATGAKAYWVIVGPYTYVLPATAHSLQIPDTSSFGISLDRGKNYDWYVAAMMSDGFSADDATDGSGLGINRFLILDEDTLLIQTVAEFKTAP
ncbi:carboxypeptidase-like regulatory domain-containing protein [Vulgatibacter incomptus]|uniref:Carboxypeptidase regulatory-like domain-containing protein n=1 Tax=Vulgatibacter incomptus TaxID=1391653 RepID=A0A0K1PBR1_9BACT|nr:carboxypeptidase-like regulatory domain-containing protein [Vulgatibacter incomptus]AKU90841.1 hypothetical protein AKJ08_1228 [Vulgatibacter incomptus]